MTNTDVAAAERLIAKWKGVAASELSTSQSFLIELCDLLGVERPFVLHPGRASNMGKRVGNCGRDGSANLTSALASIAA